MRSRRLLGTFAVAAALVPTLAVESSTHAAAAPQGTAPPSAPVTGRLDAAGQRRVAALPWRAFRASEESERVRVSPAYGDPAAIAARWSSFFSSLVHGSELSLLDAYVAPLAEVRQICGSDHVLGCYGDDHLVIPDEGSGSVAATSIATHEYGHHIAFNRVNPPWIAVDTGTKRWATAERVCPRVAAGTAFPGAEDGNYPLNPGEAFAESYRVLIETSGGLPPTWPIVDPSFNPDAAALAALRQDVVDTWTGPTATTLRPLFARGAHAWTLKLATPLDGSLHVQVVPGADDVTLLGDDGRLLRRGAWTSSGAKAADYLVCGQRTVVVRVTRHAPARRFTLRLSVP
jgi:hypothetical protein